MRLLIEVEVENSTEAYQATNEIALRHDVISADLDGEKELFNVKHPPKRFLKP